MTRSLLMLLASIVVVVALVVLYLIPGGKGTAERPPSLAALKPVEQVAPVPAVKFVDAAGRTYSLKSYEGRYVLLNLWASWCAPCVKELPALATLQRAVPARNLAGGTVDVAKGAKDKAAAFLIAHNAAELPAFADPDLKLMQAIKAFGLPTTILIDRQGREIARAVGAAEWDTPESIAWFEKLTAPKPAS